MSKATRFRTQIVEDEIDLSECDSLELVDELEARGYSCLEDGLGEGLFDHVEHLIVCGQLDNAKNEALLIVSGIIGRPFK